MLFASTDTTASDVTTGAGRLGTRPDPPPPPPPTHYLNTHSRSELTSRGDRGTRVG